MNSSASPGRKIASNYLFTGRELLADPLVEVDCEGRVFAVEQCTAPDSRAGVEYYAGVLTPGWVDACCGMLSGSDGLRHRNAGSVAVGYCPAGEMPPVAEGLQLRPLGPETGFLSQILAGWPAASLGMVVIDTALREQDAEQIITSALTLRWCLCPRALGCEALPETLARLRGRGIVPALGSYAPAPAGCAPLAECLPLLAGVPVMEVLSWALAGSAGSTDGLCGLNLVSGLDYAKMEVTDRTQLTRIL